MSCWFFTYPFDTIKTKIQTSNNLTVYDILKKYKFKNYFNGISIVLYRAAIANSITFLVYDKTIEFIMSKEQSVDIDSPNDLHKAELIFNSSFTKK